MKAFATAATNFSPVVLEITIESYEELDELYKLFNTSRVAANLKKIDCRAIREALMGKNGFALGGINSALAN